MNDPHVAALVYKIEHGPSVDYSKAEPLDRKETNFRVQITNEKVRFFEFKEHYAAENVARGAIEDYIRAWEFDAGLRGGPNYFKLKFAGAQIKDRNPTPGVISGPAIEGDLDGSISATLLVLPPYYPPPPSGVMLITPDVQTMYDRYMGYRQDQEPLTTMAYFCLTILERSTKKDNSREVAAETYGIKLEVLNKIGHLSSEKGGQQARKASGTNENLTAQDRRFLKEAIKAIIRRAAEKAYAPNSDFPEISLSDLPPV